MGTAVSAALTIYPGAEKAEPSPPGFRMALRNVTMSNSYATGGDTVDNSGLGFRRVDGMIKIGTNLVAAGFRQPEFVAAAAGAPATGKIAVMEDNGAAGVMRQTPAATDLSTVVWTVIFIGT